MVIGPTIERILFGLLAAAKPAAPLIERLDPYRKVAVVMALLAVVIVGLFLVAVTMLGGNWVRRLARHRPRHRTTDTSATHVTQNRQLRDSLEQVLPNVDTKNTVNIDRTTNDTKVDPA
jgi:hypothetical protein